MHDQRQATEAPATYATGDYVLYRDPVLFWTGKPNHTSPCRINAVWRYSNERTRYDLDVLGGGRKTNAEEEYMRLLSPIDAMHDIDTAPLDNPAAVHGMTGAAHAWLANRHATANRPPALPGPSD